MATPSTFTGYRVAPPHAAYDPRTDGDCDLRIEALEFGAPKDFTPRITAGTLDSRLVILIVVFLGVADGAGEVEGHRGSTSHAEFAANDPDGRCASGPFLGRR